MLALGFGFGSFSSVRTESPANATLWRSPAHQLHPAGSPTEPTEAEVGNSCQIHFYSVEFGNQSHMYKELFGEKQSFPYVKSSM